MDLLMPQSGKNHEIIVHDSVLGLITWEYLVLHGWIVACLTGIKSIHPIQKFNLLEIIYLIDSPAEFQVVYGDSFTHQ